MLPLLHTMGMSLHLRNNVSTLSLHYTVTIRKVINVTSA